MTREYQRSLPRGISHAAFVFCWSLFGRTYIPYILLGLINRLTGSIRSIFFLYAGNAAYRTHYTSGLIDNVVRWTPTPIGILRQAGKYGIVFGASMSERDLLKPKNRERLERLQRRLKRIAWLLDVEIINLAGILPSILRRQGKEFGSDPRPAAATAILEAINFILLECFGGTRVPIILLGGNGFIGTAIHQTLLDNGNECVIVDPSGGLPTLPFGLRGAKALLCDVARYGVIDRYQDQLWPELVVLNETFPEPSTELLSKLAARGILVFHIAGIEGQLLPSLPYSYRGAIPCCAVHDLTTPLKPKLIQLTSPFA